MCLSPGVCMLIIVDHCGFLLFLSGQRSPRNLALNKPAYQISTAYGGIASRAVDGSREPDFWQGLSCTITGYATSPWWMVDLGENYNIGYVAVTNRNTRGKCCATVKILSITSQLIPNIDTATTAPACKWIF